MVEFLLKYPQVEIGDTVLHAVRDSSTKILGKFLLCFHSTDCCLFSKYAKCAISTYSFVVELSEEKVSRIRIRWSSPFDDIPHSRNTADTRSSFE